MHIKALAAVGLSAAVLLSAQPRAQAQCYGCGGFVGGLAGGIIGGAIAGSIAANAQPRPVYVIQQRRVVKRAAPPRQRVAQPRGNDGMAQKASINTSADPFAKKAAPSAEPIPVSVKQ